MAGVTFALGAPALRAQLSTTVPGGRSAAALPPHVHDPYRMRSSFQDLLSTTHPGFQRFRRDHPGRWLVLWNEDTLTPHRLLGDGVRIEAERARDDAGLVRAARDLLAAHADLFPVDVERSLTPERVRSVGAYRLVVFNQRFRDAPVLGGRVALLIGGDRIVNITSDLLPEPLIERCAAATPSISRDQAETIASGHLALWRHASLPRTRLVVMPVRSPSGTPPRAGDRDLLEPALCWEARFPPDDNGSVWNVHVGAADQIAGKAGTVFGALDRTSHGTVSGTLRANATPGLMPDADWNPPGRQPVGQVVVRSGGVTGLTARDGAFEIEVEGDDPVGLALDLRGPWCEVDDAAGPELIADRIVLPGVPVDLLLNHAPSEFSTAQVNAFLHVNATHDFIKTLAPDFEEIDVPVLARVNLTGRSCDAIFIPEGDGQLGFFRADRCANSAYSTWIIHEYGHFMIWKSFGERTPMPAWDEGISDTLVALVTGQPMIGQAFDAIGPEPPATPAPTRDLSIGQFRFPDDVLREPHDAGQIVGHALWRLVERLRDLHGDDMARRIVGELVIGSVRLAPALISEELVLDFLILDDDDLDPFNGTPHAREILQSFADVGLHLPEQIELSHEPLEDVAVDAGGPFRVEAEISTLFEFLGEPSLTLEVSVDGGNTFRTTPLDRDGDRFVGEIPAQAAGTTVRYYLAARAPGGSAVTLPAGAPDDGTFSFAVANILEVYPAGEERWHREWRHGTIDNGFRANQDDWQWGRVGTGKREGWSLVDGNLVDPPSSFTGRSHWGNDLAVDNSSDKLYPQLSHNFLESAPIDCRGFHGVHLRFRRWLSAERGDSLRISVNGTPIYQSSNERDLFDRSWKLMDYDVSGLADDRADVVVRFELESDGFGQAGGWNIDDFRLVSTRRTAEPRPVLLSIEPPFDSIRGGSPFLLRGRNFVPDLEGTFVSFGGVRTEFVVVEDSETISGVIPPRRAPGSVTIVLSNASGFANLPGTFSYFGDPAITTVLPESADIAGGTPLRLIGRYFTPDTTRVWIGGRPLENVTVTDSAIVDGTLPPGRRPGPVDIRVRSLFGETTYADRFSYTSAPIVERIEPSSAVVGMRPVFSVFGDHFSTMPGATIVRIGGAPAEGVQVIDRTMLLGIVPRSDEPGVVAVEVETPDGVGVLADAFHYVPRSRSPSFVRGDANGDGHIDISDPVTILGFLFGGTLTLDCRDAADINDDGLLDIVDPASLLFFLFNRGAPPRPPHPDPGPDPTDDGLDCRRAGQ